MIDESRANYAGPTLDRERIDSLDILRGFALLGILIMNIQSFSMPFNAYLIPNSYGNLEGLNGLVWLAGHLFFDLKFMAMFSMMFGAGIVLMSQHRDAAGRPVIGVHYRRMILLLLFGFVHAYCIWYGDILVAYAICGMFVVWMRHWPARRLAVVGALLIVFGSLAHGLTGLGAHYSPESADSTREQFSPTEEDLQKEIDAYLGSWKDQFPIRIEEALSFQLAAFPVLFFWRISGLMLLGMALFKWHVLDASRSTRFYQRMALLGGGLGLPLVALGAYWHHGHDFDPAHVLGFGALPNWYGSVGVAFMWIALVMLLCRARAFGWLRSVLSAYGRMAFTNYIGQSLLATWVFYGYGLGWFGSLDRLQQVGVVISIWVVQLVVCPIWLHYFRFGPLEWVWRSGVYMRLQPMLRRA